MKPFTTAAKSPTSSPTRHNGKSLTFYLLGIGLALATGFAGMYSYDRLHGEPAVATLLPVARPIPSFHLNGHDGQPFTQENLKGEWSVLFFGFTHCPDVCPGSLLQLAQVTESLGSDAPQVVLISVDPERDTPAKLAKYVAHFHSNFKAATGPDKQLTILTKALSVAWHRSQPDADGNYSVDHTAWLMLINPAGQLVAYFSPPLIAAAISKDLRRLTR